MMVAQLELKIAERMVVIEVDLKVPRKDKQKGKLMVVY